MTAAEDTPTPETLPVEGTGPAPEVIRRFRIHIVEGPGAGTSSEARSGRCSIGHHPLNDLVIEEATVSRFHSEIMLEDTRVRVRDLGSTNGTIVDGVAVVDGYLRDGSMLRLGSVLLRFEVGDKTDRLRLSDRAALGPLVGRSTAMRACFAMMERAAETDVTLLLDGETGTGKSAAAEAIHGAGKRKDRSFVVVDCGAIPEALLESELFGHEKGAFTGAAERRIGAFEAAAGGTIFLDEIGELPVELQPKLLGVLESRRIKRVGSNAFVPIDVRVIAASNRDLRTEVNAGRFRSDLFFRLAVVKIVVPPLRDRVEDIALLVERILAGAGEETSSAHPLLQPSFIATLERGAWPGNVRELRNHVERCLFFQSTEPPSEPLASGVDLDAPFSDARKAAIDQFERAYLEKLLSRHGGRMNLAAEAAGIHRIHLYKLLRRHGLK